MLPRINTFFKKSYPFSEDARYLLWSFVLGVNSHGETVGLSYSMMARIMNSRYVGFNETAASVKAWAKRREPAKGPDARTRYDKFEDLDKIIRTWNVDKKSYKADEEELTKWLL